MGENQCSKGIVFKYTYYYDENYNKSIENKSVADEELLLSHQADRMDLWSRAVCLTWIEKRRKQREATSLIQTTYSGDQKIEEIHTRFIDNIETTTNYLYTYEEKNWSLSLNTIILKPMTMWRRRYCIITTVKTNWATVIWIVHHYCSYGTDPQL